MVKKNYKITKSKIFIWLLVLCLMTSQMALMGGVTAYAMGEENNPLLVVEENNPPLEVEEITPPLEIEEKMIKSISPVTVQTYIGEEPLLPSVVEAVYSDDTTTEVNVAWNPIEPSQYAQEGSFEVEGETGASIKAIATVTVSEAAVMNDNMTDNAIVLTGDIESFLDEVKSIIPEGQSVVSYTNNYQSMEPEVINFIKGNGSSTVNNGLTVDMNLDNNISVAAWGKGPWLSAGIIDTTLRYTNSSQGNVGFVLGTYDNKQGVSIRYDAGTDWVIQSPDGSGDWETFKGPELKLDQDYDIQIGFNGNRLLVIVDDVTYYNQDTEFMNLSADIGQVALYKRLARGNLIIKNIRIEGVGITNKPSDIINYSQNYEDPDYTPNWSGLKAEVVTDPTGNRVLSVKQGSGERGADLDSPKLQSGTLSLDFKLVNPTVLGNGQGFAFGFRMNETASVFNEIGVDPSRWIPESSGNHWGDALNIPYPTQGKWNNLMFNFNGKTITVYLNKKRIDDITFERFHEEAGHFGLRIRSTVELYIDNVQYTNEIIEPKEIVQYSNDFQDMITGKWSDGAAASIAAEGSNRVLKLSNVSDKTLNTDAPHLQSATLLLDVKPVSDVIGFVIGNDGVVKYVDNEWVLEKGSNSTKFTPVNDLNFNPIASKWNKVGLQYSDSSVTLSINGAELQAGLQSGEQFGQGPFGIVAQGDIYIDNILFTEEFPEMDTSMQADKMIYEEYYENISNLQWAALNNAQIADGYLNGTIAAGATAVNESVTPVEHGIYQVKMQADAGAAGIQIGNMTIYHEDQGKWVYQFGNSEFRTEIGNGAAISSGNEYIVRAQLIEKNLILYVNGALVGNVKVDGFKSGAFGITNLGSEAVSIKIDAIIAEEIRIYEPDYTTHNWSALDKSNLAVIDNGDGAIKIKMPAVALAVDKDSPQVIDQKVSFDFKTNVSSGADGGRYGFILRGVEADKYVSVVYDINGKWMLFTNGDETTFPRTYQMSADTFYKIELRLVGNTINFMITDSEGISTDMGAVTYEEMTLEPGSFGLRSWFGTKDMTVKNLKIVEMETLPKLQFASKVDTIENGDLKVSVYENFPGIVDYQFGDRTLQAGTEQSSSVWINNMEYVPQTVSEKVRDHKYEYTMTINEIGVVIKSFIEVNENQVVRFEVTDIQENSDFVVRSLQLNNSLFYVNSSMDGASYAWSKSNGEWHGITEELVDDMSQMKQSGTTGVTMAMVSANGLGASVENNVISGGNKAVVTTEKQPLVNKLTVKPGTWTYRHIQSEEPEQLPWYEVVITEDCNSDAKTDWQDAAVAYRKDLLVRPFGAEDIRNNMMYIAFNFASQANDPFLNSLDTGKVLYNFTDGFGQMILHKGYQAEGHDDDIPSYSNIGVRQGGLEDFNYLIDEGDKYNLNVGVHLNATEYHLDANELKYSNLKGATANGQATDRLSKGWDWIDTSYYVDQTKDVLSGELKNRFRDLYNLTKDAGNPDDPALDFYYIDVYTGNDYNAHKLLQYANDLGIKVGTEFAGPLEPGVGFVHWGPDLGYPNKGNSSVLSRMVKNDLDLYVGHALFKGQKVPGVTTWGDSKPDVQQGVTVFFNEVLPTKFMQHFGVLKYEQDQVTFENEVISKRNKETKMIELSKNGKLISTWKDTGTTTDESVRHTGEADSLIPWVWDVRNNEILDINEGAKLYHWNTTGKPSTWQLTNDFKKVTEFNLYELTQQGKVFVEKLVAENGALTIDSNKNTPYVLYPASADAEKLVPAAKNWGEGSLIQDFAFNSEQFNVPGSWAIDNPANITIKTEQGDIEYDITKEMAKSNWNRYAEIGADAGFISQEITGLEPGQDYTVGVWTQTEKGRKSSLEVTVGDKTYSTYVTGADGIHKSSFKYVDTKWQRMNVEFNVPEGVTTATVKLAADVGAGKVLFDDARIWKHTTVEKDVTNPDYVVYEDFENVYEGWGPFEYGGGSRQIHIATDRSNPEDDNPIAKPSENKVGPVMTWVLSGENSLKLNETDIGRSIKTNESSVKLKANQEYELGFNYTLEQYAGYEVSVQSRSTGEVVLKKTLDKFPNPGNKSGKDGGYIQFKDTFKTGAQDDYQVVFKMITKGAGGPTSDYALILDDFYIKEYSADNAKELLQQVIDHARKLNSANYTTDSWAKVATALINAEEIMKSEVATSTAMDEARVELEQAIDDLEPVISIVSIEAVHVVTKAGEVPNLPSVVIVTYSDLSTQTAVVTWEAIDPSQYVRPGTFQVEGVVEGTEIKAIANVRVTPRDSSKPDPDPTPTPDPTPIPEPKPDTVATDKPDVDTGSKPGSEEGKTPDSSTGKGKEFKDTAGHWAQKEIANLTAQGIISGKTDEHFAPNQTITRAEMAALFTRALDLMTSSTTSFKDVSDDKWYKNDVNAAADAGLFKGYGDNLFNPEKPLSRQEMAVIIVKALELKGKLPVLTDTAQNILSAFKDANQTGAWSQEALAICIQLDLMVGTPEHKLNPKNDLTRAEAAVLLSKLLIYLE